MGAIFKSLIQYISSHLIQMIIILIVLLTVIIILKKMSKISQKKKELEKAIADKEKDEKLNSYILNSDADSGSIKTNQPYEVSYGESASKRAADNREDKGREKLMVQITEIYGQTDRKFMMNAAQGIFIGTSSDNDIAFQNPDREEFRCELFSSGKNVYIRNREEKSRPILKRRKKRAVIDSRGLIVNSKDEVLMGPYTYVINVLK